MLFTKTSRYQFSVPKEHLRYRLLGNNLTIHNMNFEVLERDHALHIIPNGEDLSKPKALPIAQVDLKEDGRKTNVVVTTSMRQHDSGGPLLVLLFCSFLFIASFILLYIGKDPMLTWFLWGTSGIIFAILIIRLQMGYFSYVRKIRTYVRVKGDQVAADVHRQLFKHKLN